MPKKSVDVFAEAVLKRRPDANGFYWVIPKCPHCGKKHTHGAGTSGDNPTDFLGHREAHCLGDFPGRQKGYVLVEKTSKHTAPAPIKARYCLKAREMARLVDCCPDDLYVLVKKGVIGGVKKGRFWRFYEGDAAKAKKYFSKVESMRV